jgi:ParB family chromosome partitioning protein
MKKALGRGLSALIPNSYVNEIKKEEPRKEEKEFPAAAGVYGMQLIPIHEIKTHQGQPRHDFSPEGIEELAASIRQKGILQPIIVKREADHQYVIICGERRFRAATLCGLDAVPAVIKDIANDDFLEWALVENVQREDLNPVEEAEAYRRLAEERMLGLEEIARRVGKDRSTVTNMIRLLRLPDEIREALVVGKLTAGHARALLGLLTPEHQRQLAKRISEENLSVRQVEAIVNRSNAHKRKPKRARHLSPEVIDLENQLAQHLGTQVKIIPRKDQKQGRIEIQYFSLDDLERILEKVALPKAN